MDEKEREQALIDAIFGNKPLPRPVVPADRVIREWVESTEDAIAALHVWLRRLRAWQRNGGREKDPGDFDVALRALIYEGLERWADSNRAGGGLDRLAEVIEGEEYEQAQQQPEHDPEGEPLDPEGEAYELMNPAPQPYWQDNEPSQSEIEYEYQRLGIPLLGDPCDACKKAECDNCFPELGLDRLAEVIKGE